MLRGWFTRKLYTIYRGEKEGTRMTKRYVYNYCQKCGQATPHTIIIEQTPPYTGMIVKAKCNWCGNEIEVEWKEE